ncbi:MAG TPA: hypothetical protein VFI84_04665 [Candidatus Saccharimonadales bacterium]|nr:hypothetical protein [Candidatus Saccharimonadales bacterium]
MANASQLFKDDEEERAGSKVPSDDELRHITGIDKDSEPSMEQSANAETASGLAEKEKLANAEGGPAGADSGAINKQGLSAAENDGVLGAGFNPDDKQRAVRARSWIKRNRGKAGIGLLAGGGVIGLLFGAITLLQPFRLSDFMANVEASAFGRYQIDMRGRSSKWLQAYVVLRLGEVEDPKLAPQDRDNLLFRSDKVDTNNYVKDWYRTLRASKFEQDVFGSQGIKFSSVAVRNGNMIQIRPAKIIVNDKTIESGLIKINGAPGGDLTEAEFNALTSADVSSLNGRLRNFVEVETFNNDKEARSAIKQVVHDRYPRWWNAVKRYHLRHDIQNMIGVRSWTFFETTRSNLAEKKISIRNKIVAKMLPEDTKSGKFIQCLFGISNCKASADPANPDARALPLDGSTKDGTDKTCDANCPQGEQGKTLGDGTGTSTLGEGAADTADLLNKMISKIIAKASLLSLLDTLSRFDATLHDHKLSKLVTMAKSEQAAGLFTVFAVAGDQLKTGQVTSSEVNDFMNAFGNPTNSEGWSSVVKPTTAAGVASAATSSTGSTFTPAKDKTEFCSKEHQQLIAQPQNYAKADQEYQYLCPQYQVGSNDNNAAALESAWDNGPGLILHPILKIYHETVGGILGVFNSIVGFVTGPAINAALSALGLSNDIKQVSAWIAEKALSFFGGGSMIDDSTPSGQVGNVILEGGSVLAEATARDQGAALTTPGTAALATNNYFAYQADSTHSASFFSRYLSTSNPRSLLSQQLFAFSNLSLGKLSNDSLNVFGSALSGPAKLINSGAHAATYDPYAAAKFSAISTFDFPSECLNSDPLDMTPASSTNADDLGYFKPDELTWELMSNKEAWYDELYKRVGGDENKAMQVWNCALLDNTARGGIGALYGAPGVDAFGG